VQNGNYGAEGTCGRKHRGQQGGRSSQNTQHPTDHSLLLFAGPISSIGSNHHNKNSNRLQDKIPIRTPIKSQASQTTCFLVVVQQIMTEFSGAATEKGKAALITDNQIFHPHNHPEQVQ
jgi:hypothetical protein